MGGSAFSCDSQRWLEEALTAVGEQQRSLRAIAENVTACLGRDLPVDEEARLRGLSERLEAALRHGSATAQSLAPLPTAATEEAESTVWGHLAALEEERYRLARDIHDGPAQVLANALLELQYCERLVERSPEALRQELAVLRSSLRDGLAEVRRLIFDLRPPALVELGLVASLQHYLNDFAHRTGIAATMSVQGGEERLSPVQEAAVFRVAQEALQNVRRHACASRVVVEIEGTPDRWRMTVRDNGVGFDPSRLADGRRTLGLTSMRERSQLVGASLEVVSAPGEGTTVLLSLPAPSQRKSD